MPLQLTFDRYDDLEQLYQGLGKLHHFALEQVMALSNGRDNNLPPTREQVQKVMDVVLGVCDAIRVLGRIRLAILEDNPSYGHTPRDQWNEGLLTSTTGMTRQPCNPS